MDAEKNQGKIRLCYWGYAEGNPSIRIKMHVHDFFQANFTLLSTTGDACIHGK